jgi:TPR repeat protein
MFLEQGNGVDKNIPLAIEYFRRAVEKGNTEAAEAL